MKRNKSQKFINYRKSLPLGTKSFLDDQAIFFVFIEILLNEIARLVSEK